MIKVIFYRHSLRNRGGDFMIIQQANHLAKKGHDVTIMARTIDTHFFVDPKIHCQRVPFPSVLGTLFYISMTRFHQRVMVVDLVLLAVFGSLLNAGKILYYVQDDDETYYRQTWKRALTRWAYKHFFCQLKQQVVFSSDYLAALFKERYALKTAPVVPHGINTDFWKPRPQEISISKKKRIVIYARSDYRKGFDISVKTLQLLSTMRKGDWKAVVIGTEKPDGFDNIDYEYYGELNQNQLRSLLQQSDIYLSTTRHEGFGLLQLQAMTCGCVMVTTDAFKLVKHGVNALVAENENISQLAEFLNFVLNDDQLREKLKNVAVTLAKEYNIQDSCHLFEKALHDFFKGEKD